MKNLNEPHKAGQPEGEVISLEERRSAMPPAEHSLVPKRQTEDMRERWKMIQASFVDEPRKAVQDADQLVKSAVQQIEEGVRPHVAPFYRSFLYACPSAFGAREAPMNPARTTIVRT